MWFCEKPQYLADLKWNFAKFLCNAEGVPVKRFAPDDAPFGFEADIVSFL